MNRRDFLLSAYRIGGYAALISLGCNSELMAQVIRGSASGSCSGTLGNTLETDSDAEIGANKIVVSQITADCSGDIATIYIRVAYTNDTDRNGTYVIYSDSGADAPDTLLWSSAFTQDGISTNHWISASISSLAFVNGTKYWIGFITQSVTTNQWYSASTGGTRYQGFVADYASPPASWSSVTSSGTSTRYMEAYVSY